MRRQLKRLALAAVALPVAWLAAANLFLATPLGPRALSRGDRFRVDWGSAWTVFPGRVEARNLHLEGRSRGVTWSLDAERARGRFALRPLTERTLRFTELHGAGVRGHVARRAAGDDTATPSPRRGRGGRWRFELQRVVLDPVRAIDLHGFQLVGSGRAEGSLHFVPGGEVRLGPTVLRFADGELLRERTRLLDALALTAEATLGPYRPREHPGPAGLAFLAGTLAASAEVPRRALPAAAAAALGEEGGRLLASVAVAGGELQPGSRLELRVGGPPAEIAGTATRPGDAAAEERAATGAPAAGGAPRAAPAAPAAQGSPALDLLAVVAAAAAGGGPELRLRAAGQDLAGGGEPGAPPLFRAGRLQATAATRELGLHRLLAAGRELRAGATPAGLTADLQARSVAVAAPGSRATLRATIDELAVRLDLAALLHRRLVLDGLRAEGADLHFRLAAGEPGAGGDARAPWSLQVVAAELAGLRELAVEDLVVRGASRVGATLSYEPDGTFAVERFTVDMPAGTLLAGGAPAAERLALELAARVEPTVLAAGGARALLRRTSGTARLRGTTPSVAAVNRYLEKTPWLALAGGGSLDARLDLAAGVLQPGTRLTVGASPARVTLFESLAEGSGTITVAVEPRGDAGARTVLRVALDRFALADQPARGRPPYLRGRGLRLVATTPVALDLAGDLPDVVATLELPDAEVPDLAVYDALLPASAGLSLLGGRGRVTLKLQAASTSRRATGTATLTSNAARLRFQNVELEGRVNLSAPLVTPDVMARRFDLAGARLALDEVAYRDLRGVQPSQLGWWLHAELASGQLEWGTPMRLTGAGRIDMQSSGPLLALFAEKSRVVRWLDDVLRVEDVRAQGTLRLAGDLVEVGSLRATGGNLELRSRMRFSGARKRGHLYLRYGRLATAIELLDGGREYHLVRPLEWYEEAGARW